MSGETTMKATVKQTRVDLQEMLDVILAEKSGQYLVVVHNNRVVKVAKIERPKTIRSNSGALPLRSHMLRRDE